VDDDRALSWCAFAGVLAAASLAAAVLAPGIPPAPDSSPATVSAWMDAHAGTLRAAAILTPFTLFFGVPFLAGLFRLLRGPRNDVILPLAVALLGLAVLIPPLIGAVAEAAAVYPGTGGSVSLRRFAFDTLSISGVLPFIPAAAMTSLASLQGRATGVFPRWLIALGWIYLPVGLLGSISAISDSRAAFYVSGLALGLLGLWLLATSAVMWRTGRR
jgi:hypothetical protein